MFACLTAPIKKEKKNLYAGRRSEGKTKVIHAKDGDGRNIKLARNIQIAVSNVRSGNKAEKSYSLKRKHF